MDLGRRGDFLRPGALFERLGLGLLVGIWSALCLTGRRVEGRGGSEVTGEEERGLSRDTFDDGRGIEVGRWIGVGGAVS